eukprot:scaffold65712_cov64-Attheya_sp.AAC.5
MCQSKQLKENATFLGWDKISLPRLVGVLGMHAMQTGKAMPDMRNRFYAIQYGVRHEWRSVIISSSQCRQ